MFNPFSIARRFKEMQSEIETLRDLLHRQGSTMAQEFMRLKNPELFPPNISEPLTEEQENIIKEFLENSKLPEQIRRDFMARGGYVGQRAMYRFGERTTDLMVPTDQVRSVRGPAAGVPGTASATVVVRAGEELRDMGDGLIARFGHIRVRPRITGLDDLIREENRLMDREAWDNMDLADIPNDKE
jgi:hypothetical protein